ncbi:N-acylneuraminate cytidylyltransferase [compost metagenome]
MTVIAIITARANSKGLPGKNLMQVGGVSLISSAVRAARASGRIDRIVVTTDGVAIAEEARRCGAEVVMRPAHLADDGARSIDAVCHALQTLAVTHGTCVLLQPTSPLRTGDDVAEAVRIHAKSGQGSVVSVCESAHHPYKTLLLQGDEYLPLHDMSSFEAPRQFLPVAVQLNGAIYANRIEELLTQRTFFCEPISYYLMPASRSIDIDSEADLVLARHLSGNNDE